MPQRGRSRLFGRRPTRAEARAAALPSLDEFLMATPDHYRAEPRKTGGGVRHVLCDCPATSDH